MLRDLTILLEESSPMTTMMLIYLSEILVEMDLVGVLLASVVLTDIKDSE
jgi:hypothetical protein